MFLFVVREEKEKLRRNEGINKSKEKEKRQKSKHTKKNPIEKKGEPNLAVEEVAFLLIS